MEKKTTPKPESQDPNATGSALDQYWKDAATVFGSHPSMRHLHERLDKTIAARKMHERAELVRSLTFKPVGAPLMPYNHKSPYTYKPQYLLTPIVDLDDYSQGNHGVHRRGKVKLDEFKAGADVLVSVKGKSLWVKLTEDLETGIALAKTTTIRTDLDLKLGTVLKVRFENAITIHYYKRKDG